MDVDAYTKAAADVESERNALLKFKQYVHQRLDEAGVPTHPNGRPSAEGCRVGDRLDIALSALSVLRDMDALEDFGEPVTANVPLEYDDPELINDVRSRAHVLLAICPTPPIVEEATERDGQ